MRTRLVLGLILLFPLAAIAGDMFNAKEGLWEMTVTTSAMGNAADALSKLPPEQRAMAEQAMKQHGMSMNGNTMTMKSCRLHRCWNRAMSRPAFRTGQAIRR